MRQIFFAFLMLVGTTVFAQTKWTVDKAHSKLGFSVTHMGISDVAGLFRNFDVTITAARPDFSDAVFELVTDVASIDTEVEARDNHLKSADFFEAAAHPKMTFRSTSVKKSGKDRYKLTGNLTLRGVTKPVTMDLWYRGSTVNPMSKAETTGFQLTGSIRRSDFNLGGKFPAPLISDEVQIRADGEFVKS